MTSPPTNLATEKDLSYWKNESMKLDAELKVTKARVTEAAEILSRIVAWMKLDDLAPEAMRTLGRLRAVQSRSLGNEVDGADVQTSDQKVWQPISDLHLNEIEAWAMVDRKVIVPVDLFHLRNMLAHMVREVRASRAEAIRPAAPGGPSLAQTVLPKLERLRHLTPDDIGDTWQDQYAEIVGHLEAEDDASSSVAASAASREMLNGLTEAETSETARVKGLVGSAARAVDTFEMELPPIDDYLPQEKRWTTVNFIACTEKYARAAVEADRQARFKAADAWASAYAAFQGAFDTPVARRRDASEYAQDARRRLREVNEMMGSGSGTGVQRL